MLDSSPRETEAILGIVGLVGSRWMTTSRVRLLLTLTLITYLKVRTK